MTVRVRLLVLGFSALLGAFIAAPAFAAGHVPSYAEAGAPSYTAPRADLSVRIFNKVDAKAGQRVEYTIIVMNNGPSPARQVSVRLRTSVRLQSVTWKVSGDCTHSGKVTRCAVGRIHSGNTATTTISGIIPTDLKVGTEILGAVSVTSSTPLINTGNDTASDGYQIGVPRGAAVSASPRAHVANRLQQASDTAGKVFSFSRSLVNVTLAVLAAGVLWFVVGLTVRRFSRARRGIRHH